MAKRYFAENGIEFADVDVATNSEALKEMVVMTGQYGVPVIRVGEKAMVGWDPKEFERLRQA